MISKGIGPEPAWRMKDSSSQATCFSVLPTTFERASRAKAASAIFAARRSFAISPRFLTSRCCSTLAGGVAEA